MTKLKGTALKLHGCARCSACQTVRPASDFYKDASRSNGLSSRCRSCDQARMRSIPLRSLARELRELAARHPAYRTLIAETAASLAA
ncbi:MAG: hypothetical protein IIB77_06575 [Proteobacteria bacterium]|nr:hypothetical protein [Pseudomonadota bacterium]